ncbi:MAG: RNA methyltransferase [Deltaproteobacteria bacterium]|nr:RNA methyltransferase [Deltaproteobacteria bacterium]
MSRTSTIDSEANPRFRSWRRQVEAGRRYRDGDLALVSGARIVQEVLATHPQAVRYLLVPRGWVPSGGLEDLPAHVEVVYLAPSLLRELDLFGTRGPLVLAAPPPVEPWEPAAAGPGAWIGIPFQDPANVGAMLRSCAGLGAAGAVLLPGAASPWHPKAIRASAGAAFSVTLRRAEVLPDPGELPLIGLDARGRDLRTFDFPGRFLLMAGAEGPGLPRDLEPSVTLAVPMTAAVESLNATVAASIALYAWFTRGPSATS